MVIVVPRSASLWPYHSKWVNRAHRVEQNCTASSISHNHHSWTVWMTSQSDWVGLFSVFNTVASGQRLIDGHGIRTTLLTMVIIFTNEVSCFCGRFANHSSISAEFDWMNSIRIWCVSRRTNETYARDRTFSTWVYIYDTLRPNSAPNWPIYYS